VRINLGDDPSLYGIYARSMELTQLVDDYPTNFAK
jgi:hypothetical protein